MACKAPPRLPFLIVSHEAVVVRAEEWLTMNGDVKHGDNFECEGESSSSGKGNCHPAKLDVEMLSQRSLPPLSLHPSLKPDYMCDQGWKPYYFSSLSVFQPGFSSIYLLLLRTGTKLGRHLNLLILWSAYTNTGSLSLWMMKVTV